MNELTVEQKLAVREAQYAIVRASDAVRQAQDRAIQTVQAIARELGVFDKDSFFDMDTLQFKPKPENVRS
jgi:hypothetical protein